MVEICIAIIGLVIAMFQFFDFIGKMASAGRKRRRIRKLKIAAEEAEKLIRDLLKFRNHNMYSMYTKEREKLWSREDMTFESFRKCLWNKFSERSDAENFRDLIVGYSKEMNDQIENLKNTLTRIDETLLECESEFSLSYGFSRYIDKLRPLVYGNALEHFFDKKRFFTELEEVKSDNPLLEDCARLWMLENDRDKFKEIFTGKENAATAEARMCNLCDFYDKNIQSWLNDIDNIYAEMDIMLPCLKEMVVKFKNM